MNLPSLPLPRGGLLGTLLLLILAAGIWSSVYTVPSDSVAVVQRFGKYLKEVKPGLHFKLPFGVDVATILPVKRQLKQEFGFATPGATNLLEGQPDFKRPKTARILQTEVKIVGRFLSEMVVGWVVRIGVTERSAVPHQYTSGFQRSVEPLMWIGGD